MSFIGDENIAIWRWDQGQSIHFNASCGAVDPGVPLDFETQLNLTWLLKRPGSIDVDRLSCRILEMSKRGNVSRVGSG